MEFYSTQNLAAVLKQFFAARPWPKESKHKILNFNDKNKQTKTTHGNVHIIVA
jgi:hypothetical protein